MEATKKQINYIEILMNDVGITTALGRKNLIYEICGREVTADALDSKEASLLIDYLKQVKEDQT